MRRKVDFCADWRFIREDVGVEQADEAATEPVTLPHTWNAQDGTDGGNDYHRGRCWYAKRFPMPAHSSEEEVWLEFEGAAMSAQVFLNGNLLCTHDGGYATFRVNLTDHCRLKMFLRYRWTTAKTTGCIRRKPISPSMADCIAQFGC